MNLESVPFIKVGKRSNGEGGYILPVTLMLSLLFSAFLLHQIEVYRLEKMFFHESNQLLELESMMKYTWDVVDEELRSGSLPTVTRITFPKGQAVLSNNNAFPQVTITIVCTTVENRRYEATVLYDREAFKVLSWYDPI